MLRVKSRVKSGFVACCLALSLSPSAFAALDSALKPLPEKPGGAVVIETDPKAWEYFAKRKPFSQWQNQPEIKQLLDELKKSGLDVEKQLLPMLGSHLAIAYYPKAGNTAEQTSGTALLSMALKTPTSGAQIQTWLKQQNFKQTSLGSETLFEIEQAQLPDMFKGLISDASTRMGLLARPDHLLLVVSDQEDYQALLSPEKSLNQDSVFMAISKEMKDQKAWGYVDQPGLKLLSETFAKLAEESGEQSQAQSQQQTEAMLEYIQGLAFGFQPSESGLEIKMFSPYVADSKSSLRSYFASLAPKADGPPLSGFWSLLPEKPMLLMAGQKLDAFLNQPLPPAMFADAEIAQELKQALPELLTNFQKTTGLDVNKDLLPHFDGRYALMVNPLPEGLSQETMMIAMMAGTGPQGAMLLGTKPETRDAFFKRFESEFKINLNALADPEAGTLNNMKSLQVMVETFGVDWGGTYPANLATLLTEAKERDYYVDLKNPVNGRSGIGLKQAMLDYRTYRNYKPQASFAGMLFYEPVGKPEDGRYPSYRIYGYKPDGSWWSLSNEASLSQQAYNLPKVNVTLPPKLVPFSTVSYKGQTLHVAKLQELDTDLALSTYEPAWTRVGDFLAIGTSVDALKGLLDKTASAPLNSKLLSFLKSQDADQQNSLTYFDFSQLHALLEDEASSDPEEQAISTLAKALDHVSMAQRYSDKGQGGSLHLGLNMDKIDFEALFSAFGDTPEAPTRAKVSSVKANMHTLQTIVETYAVDWGGVYPDNLEGLYEESNQVGRQYWKDFNNPFTHRTGIGSRGAVMEMQDYVPAEELKGMVGFAPVCKEGVCLSYVIYGTGETGELIQDKGKNFTLTNSWGHEYDSSFNDAEPIPESEFPADENQAYDVRANMHTLQTLLETYAVDWGGVYPATLAGLSHEARMRGREYWKAFLNPLTKGRGIGPRGAMIDIADYTGTPDQAGLVVYEPILSKHTYGEYIIKYYIYSVAEDGRFTPEPNKPRQPMILTNS